MKVKRSKRIICGILAAVCAAAVFAGCKDNKPEETQTSDTEATVTEFVLRDGDDYAINKIGNKTAGEELPGGYKLIETSEEYQAKLFSNNMSKIIIRSGNYLENLPDLDTWADSTCASIVISNITNNAAETNFGEPSKATVCGFDAVVYDFEMIYYKFEEDPNNPGGEEIKVETARTRGRNYYFFSEQDAYAVMFDTLKADWDEQLANFEKFVADIQVTKTEY